MNRSKNAIRNIIWGFVNKGLGTLLPFLTRTALLYKLGNEYIGLNSLFTSVLGLLSLSELGIGTALIYTMYKPLAKHNTEQVCALMNLYKKCYRIIGWIVGGIGLLLMPFLKNMISGGYPDEVNLYILYAIYLFNTVVSYWMFAYKKSLIIACQRVDIQSNINSFILLFQNILQFILVLQFSDYYFYVLVLPLCTILENLIISVVADRGYPQYRAKGSIRFSEIKGIKKQILGLLMQRIGNVVLTSINSVMISSYLGLVVLGKYNNYYYIITALFGFLAIIQTSLKPVVGNSIVLESHEKNLKDFYQINYIYVWIVTWMAVSLLALYQPFMTLWVGETNTLSNTMVFLLVIYFFIFKWGDMLFVYQEAAGMWWKTRYIPVCAAAVNIGVNIVMVNLLGLEGIPLGTILSVLIVYDFGYAKILFSEYFGKEHFKGYLYSLFKYALIAGIAAGLTLICCRQIKDVNIISLLFRGMICLIVPNTIVIMFNFRNPVFKSILCMLKKKFIWRAKNQ